MRMAEVTVGTEVPTGRADRTPGLCGEGRGRAPAGLQCSPQGQARDRNSFSIRSRFTVWSSPSSAAVMHCCSPLAIILKPARSSARDTAASWVTTSAQSRPDSSIAMTPRIWPSARRNRLITSPVAFWSTRIAVSSSWRAGPTLPPGVLPGRLSTHDRLMTHGSPAPTGILGAADGRRGGRRLPQRHRRRRRAHQRRRLARPRVRRARAPQEYLFDKDMAALQVHPPAREPRARHHVTQVQQLAAALLATRHAYEREGHASSAAGPASLPIWTLRPSHQWGVTVALG